MLAEIVTPFAELTLPSSASPWLRAALWLLIGVPTARFIAFLVHRAFRRSGRSEVALLISRSTFIAITLACVFSGLNELGVDLSVLLGAAGILTVAIGFASQTSASNVISGLFLVGERPFTIGDVIQVGTTTGTVESVDLVSIKLRTFDNLYVRIPNETLFKAEIWNLTHYHVRRYTFFLHFSYEQDLEHVTDVLLRVADDNLLILDEPAPLVTVDSFGESSIRMQFSVWGLPQDLSKLRSSVQRDLKRAFDDEQIRYGIPRTETYLISEQRKNN